MEKHIVTILMSLVMLLFHDGFYVYGGFVLFLALLETYNQYAALSKEPNKDETDKL